MGSLAQRVAFAMTAAAGVPLLLLVVPRLVSGAYGAVTTALLVIGWSCIVVGSVGLASWFVARSLLAPLMQFIESLNPSGRTRGAVPSGGADRLPVEIRLARAAVVGREEAHQRTNDERSQYVSTLIHDMKTPLIAIGRSIELAKDATEAARRETWLQLDGEEVNRLLSIGQDVVDAERLASGALSVSVARVCIGDVLHRIVDRTSVTRPQVACRVAGSKSLVHHVDPTLIERAIENVVANAFHHAESRVLIELMPGLIRVSDDGPGMAATEAHVSQAQIEAVDSRSGVARRSSGLGVLIAKRILAAHGGRLVIESTGSTGTTLLLYLGPGGPGEVDA